MKVIKFKPKKIEKEQNEFARRLERIRASLEKMNKLMKDLQDINTSKDRKLHIID